MIGGLGFVLPASGQAVINEEFDLDIVEKHIHEYDFERSMTAGLATAENLLLIRIGASVNAKNVEISLRGITGHVRFHADPDRFKNRFVSSQGPVTKDR